MLEIRDLHKVYGKYHALNGLNMTVRDGALYGFVGPNGAGKTTTIKIMAGLLGADGGSVMIGGEDGLASPARLKKMIGYVPDFFGVYDNLTVSEYMEFFASCYNMDGLVARKRYTALLEQVGLEDRLDFYVDGLSRGMKQRLCLARALIHDPEILILDEPTSGLDYRECVKVMDIIRRIHERGTTVVMVCHDMEVVADYAARCIVMSGGEVVDDAPTFDVLRNRETLERASLVPPQIVELSLELGREMPHLADGPVGRANTLDEMAAAVMEEVRTSERSVCA